MSDEEPNLFVCMQKLKIMPRQRPVKIFRDEDLPIKLNPFRRRHKQKKATTPFSLFGPSCACKHKRTKCTPYKKLLNPNNKVLREPIIVLREQLACTHNWSLINKKPADKSVKLFGGNERETQQDFKSIVDRCQQLSITNEAPNLSPTFRELRSAQRPADKSVPVNSSCSQQAMARLCVNPPCDVTIDELASYFETFVHIPKKMSSMAEMMYI